MLQQRKAQKDIPFVKVWERKLPQAQDHNVRGSVTETWTIGKANYSGELFAYPLCSAHHTGRTWPFSCSGEPTKVREPKGIK